MRPTDPVDLNATTIAAKSNMETAHNLGLGDGECLLNAGLMARSNAALSVIEQLKARKEAGKRFEELIYEQMRHSLDAINAEMDWLDEQIKSEEKVIQANNAQIDFIRTLDEDNIYGDDGSLRQDVAALIKQHGYDDLDGKTPDEIMLILQVIETDLHGDNLEREDRIGTYQSRHEDLRRQAREMQKSLETEAPPELRKQLEETLSRQPYEVSYRAMKEAATANEAVSATIETLETEQNFAVESSGFNFGKPS